MKFLLSYFFFDKCVLLYINIHLNRSSVTMSPHMYVLLKKNEKKVDLPPVRFELTTPGLRDQCSTTELKRLLTVSLF
jgi:hypothetical protein